MHKSNLHQKHSAILKVAADKSQQYFSAFTVRSSTASDKKQLEQT